MSAKNYNPFKIRLGSYPSATVIFSITLALFFTGVFGLLLFVAADLRQYIKENIQMQVYLDRAITDTERANLGLQLIKQPFVAQKEGKPQITYISKEVEGQRFIKETGEDFSEFLGNNPLRDSYRINIEESYASSSSMSKVKAQILQMPGVFEVSYYAPLVDSINKNLSTVAIVIATFSIILLGTCILLISNTIRLALFSQRLLIRSMQLVGANPWFIQKPFASRAFIQGLISAGIAIALLTVLTQGIRLAYPDLVYSISLVKFLTICIVLLFAGSLLGVLSALSATRKFLRLSLDQLY